MKIRWIDINEVEREETASKPPSLKSMQEFVGGFVQIFDMLVDNPNGGKPIRVTCHCNEEGKLLGMPVNDIVSRLVDRSAELMNTVAIQRIHGNCVITHKS